MNSYYLKENEGVLQICKMLGYKQVDWFKEIVILIPYSEWPENIEITKSNYREYSEAFVIDNLHFDTDFNLQMKALNFICTIGKTPTNVNGNTFDYQICNNYCKIFNKYDEADLFIQIRGKTNIAIFGCIEQFALYFNNLK